MTNPFDLGGFELDLGNLEKSSGLIINDRKRAASIVNSQDDGPTDFTFNMGKWMKGTDAHAKNDTQQVQPAEIQAEKQALEQPPTASDTNYDNINRNEQRSPDCYSHISGFTDGSDGPFCSSTISPVRRPKIEKNPTEQPVPARNTSYSPFKQIENYAPRCYSHISGFTDGTDGPMCSSTILPARRPNIEKKPTAQPAPASNTAHNTIRPNEHHSSDRSSHISGFTDGPDGPICSSTLADVRNPKVKEVADDSVYTLDAPAYPHTSDEVVSRATSLSMPTLLHHGSGSSQKPPADNPPRSRRSSDPRAPGSPTPLAKQSSLQRNPLVDAIIASRGITSPNSRAAAIMYVYFCLTLSLHFSNH